ncbi:alpha/beta hydrolase fold protein [Nostoc sp. NIES-4103]|nr:alpha/beta hydrolase fold protein [Nostoc sp. NIES-4103]
MKDWWEATFPKGRQSLIIPDAQGYPVEIAYGEKGIGKPLILLHGMGCWSYSWRHSIAFLSRYFRVICFDAKCTGFSEKPLSRREYQGHQIIETKRVIQALCDEPVVIIGESLGGLVALALAQNNPNLVKELIVINVPIFSERLPHWSMSLFAQIPLHIMQTIDSWRLAYLFAPLIRAITTLEWRTLLFDPSILTEEDIYWITYPLIEIPGTLAKSAEELQIAVREFEYFQANQPNMLTKIQNNLGAINCSTLILWGEQDSWFPVSHGKKLHQHIPNSQFQILPNCCHDASTGSFKVLNTAIIKFLKKSIFW